jgi:hypothetical protein
LVQSFGAVPGLAPKVVGPITLKVEVALSGTPPGGMMVPLPPPM